MRVLPLFFVAPAIFAQAPSAAASLEQALKAQGPAIEAMILTDPQEAYAKAKSLLPAAPLAFDKSTPQTVMRSRIEALTLIQIQFLVARTGRAAGELEKAKETYQAAIETAKAAKADTYAGLKPTMDTWKAAEEKAKAALAEGKAHVDELNAKPADQLTEQDKQELANYKIHKDNAERAPKVIEQLNGAVKDIDAYQAAAQKNMELMEKRLSDEKDDLAKPSFKGNTPKYVKQALKDSASLSGDKEQYISVLSRLAKLDPANKAVKLKLDQTLGKAPAKPERPVAKGGKKKGK